jgi:Predicted transcriptional regulators
MKFGDTLRATRARHRISQSQLGRLLGVSKQAVSLWEKGVTTPRDKRLDRLCILLGWDYYQVQLTLKEEDQQ